MVLGPFPGGKTKWSGPEFDHTLPSGAEAKNEWSCTSTHNCLYGVKSENLLLLLLLFSFCMCVSFCLSNLVVAILITYPAFFITWKVRVFAFCLLPSPNIHITMCPGFCFLKLWYLYIAIYDDSVLYVCDTVGERLREWLFEHMAKYR